MKKALKIGIMGMIGFMLFVYGGLNGYCLAWRRLYDRGNYIGADGLSCIATMAKINWWRVASIALLAGSALLGFGHDLIEDQKSEDELHDMVQEEVRKQLAEKNNAN